MGLARRLTPLNPSPTWVLLDRASPSGLALFDASSSSCIPPHPSVSSPLNPFAPGARVVGPSLAFHERATSLGRTFGLSSPAYPFRRDHAVSSFPDASSPASWDGA